MFAEVAATVRKGLGVIAVGAGSVQGQFRKTTQKQKRKLIKKTKTNK
jgi:hypothetical protein